ncbi:MAG TPA: trypsin-like peptidase domain-containing protein [Candidatus Brocadiaceae bacterium]|nr:trypsin-like peptidase domain-containing protein [Candidatus Brocadiaceae bacterium]
MKYLQPFPALVVLCSLLFASPNYHATYANQQESVSQLKQDLLELEKITKPFIQTFQKVSQLACQSVVSLITEKKDHTLKGARELLLPYKEYPPKREPHPENAPKKGFGSGIIVTEDGYILTNYHVIKDFSADEIAVVTHTGEQYKDVKIVGIDPNTDLAVIKIDGKDFLPAEFGDSESVQVGDWVITIGSPFGYQQTVSTGIISAKGRTHVIPFTLPFTYENFFQTDAAVNPGNSGGPLLNLRGEVIGVNTAIATRSGGFQGIGFAISASIAKETAEALIAGGHIVRGYLGVGTREINDDLADVLGLKDKKDVIRRFRLPSEKGVFVLEVWSDTPATKAGIVPGDIITEIDGKRISNMTDLQQVVRHVRADTRIIVKVIRDGAENALEVEVEQQPDDLTGRTYTAVRKLDEPTKFSLGLLVNDLSLEVAKSMGFEGEKGVLVVDVELNSEAERAGIKPGDLITMVGSKKVNSFIEFMTLMDEFLEKNSTISVFVKNRGFITLK